MIQLHQFAPCFGLPSASPFCMKVETLLRMAGLPYETVTVRDPSSQPKGKAPVLVEGDKTVPDSTFIARYLEEAHGADFNKGLTDEQKATGHMLQVMLEERTYWAVGYSRWLDEVNWDGVKEAYFGAIPMPIRMGVAKLARKTMTRNLQGHGLGRHTQDEIYALGIADLRALAQVLGDKLFIMGDEPSLVDATAYACLANILVPPVESPLKEEAKKHPAFQAYVDRMTARYFSE